MVRLKLIQHSESQLALTAFYSDHSGEAIKGVMAARINPVTGDLLNSDFREISTEVIAASNDSQENASDSVEIKKGTDVGISSAMVFRNFIYTPDNGLIVTAEKINSYTHTVTSSTSASSGAGYSRSSNTYQTFDCDDILIFKLDEKGSIKWLKMLPKQQHESFEIGSSLRTDLGYTSVPNYYANSGINNWPFYSGFGVFEGTDKVTLVLNDNESNAEITRAGQRPTRMMYYGKSTCYAVTYDMNNGNCTRTVLFSNKDKDVPTAMPRMGKMLAEDFYMIGKQDKILGKSKVAIAKLSIK